ncbi:hypothetical protein D9611_008915 [Ephemerocybe angulata]|uniref:Meiotically up-regulated protein Msb1/Mug8 domain-containing protein n=1 Tax=Ephemerocybe angulata TaxID=980116 RepID=A0A8H5BZ83_9AGAR|nr:hypothetical protein D9611_008915 [Tulosesus angulatus]
MPSLFSRSRTFSTPNKKNAPAQDDPYDEFGRAASRLGSVTLSSKKDKKKGTKRSGTLPASALDVDEQHFQFPDGTFLPLNLERPRSEQPPQPDAAGQQGPPPPPRAPDNDYGYLCYDRHVVLGLEQLERLVDVVANELETRGGITTPFIFNNTALDISSSRIKRLIHSFVATCAAPGEREAQAADLKWREEAQFAGPHELGMCLRWGLARVIRSVGGQDVRGLVSWEHYSEWRDAEAALRFPPAHFQMFLPELAPPLQFIIVRLLSLLARLIANSTASGHTPPTLSPLFGPLFFGLGPPTLAFHHAYIHYLRAANAMEHIILAFIRWQDAPRSSSGSATGSAAGLGVPIRLKEWIKGYPANLPFLQNPKAKPQPRKGSRTVRVMSVRRNVRMYSADLVKSASTWGQKTPASSIQSSFALSKEWERIAPSTLKLPPRYSDPYKKRMNMSNSFHPEVSPGSFASSSASSTQTAPSLSLSSTLSSDSSSSEYFGLGNPSTERSADNFRSLTDMKWGEFEDMGFSSIGNDKKLQFDLTESARQERKSKRQTLDWNDFSSAGFSRMDAPLSATLQFSTPVVNTVSTWPAQQAEMHRKLKKQQKALPSFGWDTEPVIGNEEVIEAAFLDVFCDLIYGGGWMDLERGEALDRDCNWALVEYKSLPPARSTVVGGSDPRTDTTLILFEEFVPLEYRQQLAIPAKARRRLPSLFSPSKQKQWKQAATLNGRPYVVGHVPRSPSFREVEFEGMLQGSVGTKVISLSKQRDVRPQPTAPPLPPLPDFPIPPPPSRPAPTLNTLPTPSPSVEPLMETPSKKSRFRLPVSPSVRRSSMVPAEYSTVEFQTRMASYSDDEHNGGEPDDEDEEEKQRRRETRSDAWVDILVGAQGRRMESQAAAGAGADGRRRAIVRRSDPDMASMEVAQVLAAVGKRSVSPGSDVDEVETVPRHHRLRHGEDEDDDESESQSRLAYDQTTDGGHTSGSHGVDVDGGYEGEGEVDEELAPILNARQMAREQRRLGYFDLHPERRPASQMEDPRERLARDSVSDDESEEQVAPIAGFGGSPGSLRPLPRPPGATAPPPPPPALAPVQTQQPQIETRRVPDIKISTNAANGLQQQQQPPPAGQESARTPTGTGATSKTAALIELYRERERTGSVPHPSSAPVVVAPLNVPSRLPVRSASLPVKDKVVVPAPSTPSAISPSGIPVPVPVPVSLPVSAPVAVVGSVGGGSGPLLPPPAGPGANSSSPRIPSPSKVVVGEGEPVVLPVPVPAFVDPGRASPARYVHGAPLQNVLEEEEEE